jgi:hypothetical protein
VSLISILADLSGLTAEIREHRLVMTRIAEALERVSPPLPPDLAAAKDTSRDGAVDGFHMAESPEEYQARTNSEAELAISLGFAPWSPALQQVLSEFRSELMQPRMETNEEGQQVERPGFGADEAETIIRDAFALAKAEANQR